MAIHFNEADVIAYLRSIGAPESSLTLPPCLLRAYSRQLTAILLRVAITVLLQLPLCPPLPPFLPPS